MINLSSKQKRLIRKIKFDKNLISFKINHYTLEKIKCNIERNVNISICKGKLIFPYVLTTGICLGIGSAIGATPFIPDKEKNHLKQMEELDSCNNIRYERQYECFDNGKNSITYYSKWILNSDGKYHRDVKVYDIGEMSKDRIKYLLNGSYTKTPEELFGNPIINKMEIKNNILEKDAQMGSYIQARFYSEDDDDYIWVNESINNNIMETIVWMIIYYICVKFIRIVRYCFPFEYDKKIKEIEKKYSCKEKSDLKKQLEIRTDNYNRLKNCDKYRDELFEMINDEEFEIFKYLNPDSCTSLSNINGEDLQKLFVLLDKIYLNNFKNLNFDSKITYGFELELENIDYPYISKKIRSIDGYELVIDGSLKHGIEINSPIMNGSSDWSNFNRICSSIQKGCTIGTNSAGHIHLGTQILGDNPKYWLNFIKLYSTYENVIFRFLYGEYLTNRSSIEIFAKPIGKYLWQDYLILKEKKDLTTKDIIEKIDHGRECSINFKHVVLDKLNDFCLRNTIEFRGANNSKKIEIHQNNLKMILMMIMYAKSDNFNDEIIENRYKNICGKYDDLDWFNEVYLEQSLEFCDLIYNNNLDKMLFLKQYLKSFEISYTKFCKTKKPLTN